MRSGDRSPAWPSPTNAIPGKSADWISLQRLPCKHRPRPGTGVEMGVGGSGRFSPGGGRQLSLAGRSLRRCPGGVLRGDGAGFRPQRGHVCVGLLPGHGHALVVYVLTHLSDALWIIFHQSALPQDEWTLAVKDRGQTFCTSEHRGRLPWVPRGWRWAGEGGGGAPNPLDSLARSFSALRTPATS